MKDPVAFRQVFELGRWRSFLFSAFWVGQAWSRAQIWACARFILSMKEYELMSVSV
jgi:hypothetical protein